MTIFGSSTGPMVWAFPNANEIAVSQATIQSSVTISKLTAVSAKAQSGLNVRAVIYAHNSTTGRPGDLIAASNVRTSVPGGDYDLTFPSPVALSTGSVWIGLLSDTTILSTDSRSGGSTYYYSTPYSSGPPATFSSSAFSNASTRPIYGLWDGAGMQVSKLNVYAVIEDRVLDPIRLSQAAGFAVVQDPLDPIHLQQARAYAVVQDPLDPIHLGQARAFAVVQDPLDPIHLGQTYGYAVVEDGADPQLLHQAYGYAVVQDSYDFLVINQTYGFVVIEQPNDSLRMSQVNAYVVRDLDPLETIIHVTT